MITDEQLKDRVNYLGSSDAAGVLGLSRWETPLSIWATKTGQYIKPEVESEAAELGKELEDYVARRFERKTNKKVERLPDTKFHHQYAFLGANVDRIIQMENAGLECKTASAWKAKEWDGEEIPQEYIIQVYHQMMVTGFKKWYLAVLIGNQDFKIKELDWDDAIIKAMEKREVEFWNEFVIPKKMPTSNITYKDTDVLTGLFPMASPDKIVQLSDEANRIIESLIATKQDYKNVENLIETLENQLKVLLGNAEEGYTLLYRIAWNNIKTRRFDVKAFEISNPDLAKQFKPERIIRRFSYKSLKEEK